MKVCPECERQYGGDVDYCAHDGTELRPMEDDSGDPLLGRVLDGRWRIEEKIGEGGMGSIYLASQKSVEREVVVKTLRAALSDNEEFSERFMQEARVTSSINHPHCVTIFDFGQSENNTLYLAMEYLDGVPLADRLEAGPLSIRGALETGMQVASALSAAHEHDVVHRDLKPENIFLLEIPDGSTFVKVLDFGISKDLGADEDITQTGQLFGTPRYMSPEQCRGDDLDGRSDLYSLGCILYEMLAGRTPFVGEKSMEILVAHVQDEVPHLTEVAERDVPERTVDLVMRLLEKEPEERPGDAGEVRQILDGILSDWVGSGAESAAPVGDGAQSGAAENEESGTAPGIGPDLGRAKTVTPAEAEEGERTEPVPGDSTGAPSEEERAREIEVGDPPPSRDATPRRAHPTDRKTVDSGGDGWMEGHRGLVVALAGLAMLTGLLVCGGGGYLMYYRAQSEGEGPLASLFGVGRDAGPPSDTSLGRGDTTGDAGGEGRERAVAKTDESAGPSEQVPAASGSGEPSGEESGARQGNGAGDDGDDAGTGGPVEDESAVGGRPEEESTAPEEGNETSAETAPAAAGADEESNEQPEPNGEMPSESEAASESTASSDSKTDAGPGDENDRGEEPPSTMPDPASFVRRRSFSASGSACNREDVGRKLEGIEPSLGRCYRDVAESGSPSGSMMLEWTISTEGKPIDTSVLTSDFSGAALSECVLRHVSSVAFASPSGGRCYTRVTFEFRPPR